MVTWEDVVSAEELAEALISTRFRANTPLPPPLNTELGSYITEIATEVARLDSNFIPVLGHTIGLMMRMLYVGMRLAQKRYDETGELNIPVVSNNDGLEEVA